jgi:hypothetical protein
MTVEVVGIGLRPRRSPRELLGFFRIDWRIDWIEAEVVEWFHGRARGVDYIEVAAVGSRGRRSLGGHGRVADLPRDGTSTRTRPPMGPSSDFSCAPSQSSFFLECI